MNVGNRIKELRIKHDLTQKELAKEINTTQTNIGRWEKNLNDPAASFIIRLADFFQCSTDYLLGREDDLGVIHVYPKTDKLDNLPALYLILFYHNKKRKSIDFQKKFTRCKHDLQIFQKR